VKPGGEMQRVAIARAMVNRPEVLLADEPTGNLDTKRSVEIVPVLKDLNQNVGRTIVMVTHNQELARQASRMFEMQDGRISLRQKRRRLQKKQECTRSGCLSTSPGHRPLCTNIDPFLWSLCPLR